MVIVYSYSYVLYELNYFYKNENPADVKLKAEIHILP